MKKYFTFLLFTLLLIFSSPGQAWVDAPSTVETKDLGGGLAYSFLNHSLTGNFHFITVRCDSRRWQVVPSINPNAISKCGTVKQLAIQSDPDAICSINASFFDTTKTPIGTVAINGDLVSLDNRKRTCMGIKIDGSCIIERIQPRAFVSADDYFEPIWIWGYNHPEKTDAIVGYNIHYGKPSITIPQDGKAMVIENEKVSCFQDSGEVTITPEKLVLIFRGKSRESLKRFKVGSIVTLGLVMPKEWKDTSFMITGGPRIIDDARLVDLKKNHEDFDSTIFREHTRTLTGVTWNDEIFFAVFPNPVTFEDAAKVLLELNVRDAMGLDGGSSTSLWLRDLKSINGSKEVPVALSIVPRCTDAGEFKPLPWFENKYWH